MISLQHTTCMGDCSKKHMLDCLLGSCWGRWGKKPGLNSMAALQIHQMVLPVKADLTFMLKTRQLPH